MGECDDYWETFSVNITFLVRQFVVNRLSIQLANSNFVSKNSYGKNNYFKIKLFNKFKNTNLTNPVVKLIPL